MYTLHFTSMFGRFEVVALSRIYLVFGFLVLFGFFKGWSGLFCLWHPDNPDYM